MEVLHLNKESYEKLMAQKEHPVLIDFWATWCGPCMKLTPELEKLAAEFPDLIVGKLSVEEEENIAIATNLGVNAIPALFYYKDGELKQNLVGYFSADELKAKLGL